MMMNTNKCDTCLGFTGTPYIFWNIHAEKLFKTEQNQSTYFDTHGHTIQFNGRKEILS
jgi:hypothetical protein